MTAIRRILARRRALPCMIQLPLPPADEPRPSGWIVALSLLGVVAAWALLLVAISDPYRPPSRCIPRSATEEFERPAPGQPSLECPS